MNLLTMDDCRKSLFEDVNVDIPPPYAALLLLNVELKTSEVLFVG